MTDCLSLYKSEDELPLLVEIAGLAKTSLGAVTKGKNSSSLVPLLTFLQKFIYLHGSKIEPNRNTTVHEMAKGLMLLSYDAVRSCAESSEDSDGIASPMFDTLSTCAKKCPIFLLSLSRDGQPVGEIMSSSFETAPMTMQSNEMDVALSSIRFLKELVSFCCGNN